VEERDRGVPRGSGDPPCYRTHKAEGETRWKLTASKAVGLDPAMDTKSFAVVFPDGLNMHLDDTGNAKASEFIRTIGKRTPIRVIVTGEANRRRLRLARIDPRLAGQASRGLRLAWLAQGLI
jgi:hypothetical protein